MKRLFTLFVFTTFSFFAAAQFEVVISADQVLIPADHYQQLDNSMGGEGQIVCYRLYAEFPDGFQLSSIYGTSTENAAFNIQSGNTFYQNPNGAALGFGIDPASPDPLLAYDSWFTIGAQNSIEASEFMVSSAIQVIPFFDNFELGYDVAVDEFSVLPSEAALFVLVSFDSNSQPMSQLNQPDEDGRVLIGQFTTRQFVSGCFSLSFNDLIPAANPSIDQTVCFSFSPTYVSADFNQDGFVDILDLNIIINDFGCINGCNADLNGDGLVTVADMNSFIYFYTLYGDAN